MKHILVTGATGFVGSYAITELLAKGYKIRALVRESSIEKAKKLPFYNQVDWVQGSLSNLWAIETALETIDTVLHCASLVSFDNRKADLLMQNNVECTKLLIDTCLIQPLPPHVIHIGSISAITGERNQSEPLTGNSSTVPDSLTSNYGKSKYLQELEIWRGVEEGLKATILSPGFILGARLDSNWSEGSASIFKYVYDRKPFYTYGTINYVSINDVVKGIVKAVETKPSGRHVLVGGTRTYKDFFQSIATHIEVPAPKLHLKPWMSNTLARIISIIGAVVPLPEVASPDALLSAQRKTVFSGLEAAHALNIQYELLSDTINKVVEQLKIQKLVH